MPKRTPSFTVVLVGVGAALALMVTGYLVLRESERHPESIGWTVEEGNADRGRVAIERYGCGACHRIEGLRSADGRVGPRLDGIREQQYIAGQLPNEPDNLVRWIMDPQHIEPGTAMPDLRVTEADARDIAAYLYSLE